MNLRKVRKKSIIAGHREPWEERRQIKGRLQSSVTIRRILFHSSSKEKPLSSLSQIWASKISGNSKQTFVVVQ